MLVEKEIISPGVYWYVDEKTGVPRKLEVTPELTKYWHDQGSKMLSAGLPIPVPCEHDFDQHPMTAKDKLLNNAGEIKEYRLRQNVLFGVVDVKDDMAQKKINNGSIKWTSPWINSFTDGDGRQWNNVITHLALTTRPRITKQAPFPSIAAALSLASDTVVSNPAGEAVPSGFCLSAAGKLVKNKRTGQLRPLYPMAFSLMGGAKFAEDDDTKPLKKKEKSDSSGSDSGKSGGDKGSSSKGSDSGGSKKSNPFSKSSKGESNDSGGSSDSDGDGDEFEGGSDTFSPDDGEGGDDKFGTRQGPKLEPFGNTGADVRMEEILCDLLNALGVFMPENVSEGEFKRALYEAAMGKVRELTTKAQSSMDSLNAPPQQNPSPKPMGAGTGGGTNQPNPLVQQEQQPMYMSLEDINKLPEPMKGLALSMHNEVEKLRAANAANEKVANSLRDAKLKEAGDARNTRVALLSKRMPSTKARLEAMIAQPGMALSMGEGGVVIDPMADTLALLEAGLVDVPTLLTTPAAALSIQQQPTDGELSQEVIDKVADEMARNMGCPPEKKAG